MGARSASSLHQYVAFALVLLLASLGAPGVVAATSQAVEVAELRTADSRTFKNQDGTFTTSVFTSPVHYRDGEGKWQPISSTLVPADKPGYAWRNEANSFRAQFKESLESDFLHLQVGGTSINLSLEGTSPATGRPNGASIGYPGVFSGVDLRYEVLPDGVKETLVLADAHAPARYRFVLEAAEEGQALSAQERPDGSWAFFAGPHDPILVLNAPFAYDSASAEGLDPEPEPEPEPCEPPTTTETTPTETETEPAETTPAETTAEEPPEEEEPAPEECEEEPTTTTTDGEPAADAPKGKPGKLSDRTVKGPDPDRHASMSVTQDGDRFLVDVSVDQGWLHHPDRVFPVMLDPTITIQPGLEDATFVGNCPSCVAQVSDRLTIGTNKWYAYRAALTFDVGDLPAGANVSQADLVLTYDGWCISTGPNSPPCQYETPIDAHRITSFWTTSSTTSQLAYDSTVLSTYRLPAGAEPYLRMGWDVTTAVRSWQTGTPNYGILLKRNAELKSAGGPAPPGRRYVEEPSIRPHLDITWASDGVQLLEPHTLHANGADLEWTPYAGTAPFEKYEVHRSASSRFTPSAQTLIATIGDPAVTSYRDTTAAPARSFTYKVVANASVSNERTVTLPAPGRATKLLQPGPAQGKAVDVDLVVGETACENYGGDQFVYVGSASGGVMRSLLRFDLRDVPAGATVQSATLSMWFYDIANSGTIRAYPATSAWQEGTGLGTCTGDGSTWYETEAGVKWKAEGGDFDPTAAASIALSPTGNSDWHDFNVTGLAQNWVTGAAPNHGVLLKLDDERLYDRNWFFYFSDDYSPVPTLRPKLSVTYTDGSTSLGPTVSIASPAPGQMVSGTVAIAAASSDDGRVDEVEFLVDGNVVGSDSSAPYSVEWSSTGGSHTLKARATDDAGSVAESTEVPIVADNSPPPATSVTSPAAGSTVTQTATVEATASDDGAVTRVEFFFDDLLVQEDTAAPYSASWNTLDPAQPAYDGAHALTTKAYTGTGQVTTSASVDVAVANAAGTKYQADFTSTPFPLAIVYDPEPGATQDKHGIEVAVTNRSSVTWSAADVVLRSRWVEADGTQVAVGPDVSLGGDLAAGATRTLTVLAAPPVLPDGVNRAQYRLRIDLFEKSSGTWFAAKGNKPLENPVIVNKALVRGALGLERYYHYVGEELGAGMQQLVNVANGNSVVRWTPFLAPGRGLSTVVDLTYNALERKCECPAGNNWSLSISSLTRFGNPIDIHPNRADEIAGRSSRFVELTDADGTTHRFEGRQAADGTVYWEEPAGVHLYLRVFSQTDPKRQWALTRPDRVTFFYDGEGYPTFVRDRNGNQLAFTLEQTPPGEDPGGPKKRITRVNDAGNRFFAITYWSRAEAKKAHVRGKIQRIADHTGSALDFEYYEDGNLLRLIQRGGTKADGSFLADRSWVFTYTDSPGNGPAITNAEARRNPDPGTAPQSTRLFSVIDPRGNETTFAYLGSGAGEDRWKLASRTDRGGATISFSYATANRVTTVTKPLDRVWRYGYDVEGKATSITNPLAQTTTQAWSGDRMLVSVTEPTGVYTEFAYNDNGLLADVWDQLRNHTTYEYENVAVEGSDVAGKWRAGRRIPHVSQLSKLTTPKGTATVTPTTDYQASYAYDANGNLTSVTDPEGFVTRHTYNPDGTLASTTDANNHTTTHVSYDANGLATEIRDAKGQTTRHFYDGDGLLRWTQDPLHASDTGANEREYKAVFDYDSFHRLGATSEPKSTKEARGTLIWTATEFDPNDNVTSRASPADAPVGGAKTTDTYDAMDRQTAEVGPDQSAGQERTEFVYDGAGRLTRITLPLGVASTGVANDYVTETTYDVLDRTTKETRYAEDGTAAAARVTNYCYDLASDLRSITAPRGARSDAATPFTSCPPESAPLSYDYTPASYTTKYAYFADHRLRSTTDPLGNTSSLTFDANGNFESETDEENNTQRYSYNARDELVQEERSFDPNRPTRKLTAKYEYDGTGNIISEISPRAVDAQGAGPYTSYVTRYGYDPVNQLTTIRHPVDGGTRQAWTHYGYDANGNRVSASLPVDTDNPALVPGSQQTRVTYYDTGWIRTVDYPDRGVTSLDYAAQGWQTSRRPAGGPVETWTYYDDGELKENTDPNGHPNRFTYDLNNNLIKTDDATGVDDPAEAPLKTEQDYNGFDEPIEIRQSKEPPGQTPPPWRVTTFAYDANGNLQQRVDEGRTQTFGYDQADRVTSQLDANRAGCGDDRQLTLNYLRNRWSAGEIIRKSDGGCDPATWPIRRQTAWTYFSNGDLRTVQSWKGAQSAANLIESHTLEYESDGVYLNGHRVNDTFTLQGPGSAPCRTSSCSATFAYDARERLTQWTNGLPGADASTTAYTLDPNTPGVDALEGNVVREIVSGAGARTRDYTYSTAGQLLTLSVNGTLAQRYFWDKKSGNIRCVTDQGYTDDTCTANAGLRDWYKFDPLDRLKVFKSYRTNATVDSSYVYDAFDRVSTEAEAHNGGAARTTEFTYLALTGEISTETQRAASTTKQYAYDADDERVGVAVTTASTQDFSFARNPRGDISLLVDDSGGLMASYAYKPYGELDVSVSRNDIDKTNPFNPFRFNDRRFDSGSRSIDMGARRYEPDDGRFLEQDFLREAEDDVELSLDSAAQNRYGFAGGNPVTFTELDGHQPGPRAACGTIGAFASQRVYSFAYLNPEDFPGFAFRIAFDISLTKLRMANLTCRSSDRWRTRYSAIYDTTSLARPFRPTLKLGWIVEMQNTFTKRRDFGKIIAQVRITDPGAKWPSSTGGRTTFRTGSPTWVPRWIHFAVTLESDIWIWPPFRRTTCPLRPRPAGQQVRPINAPPPPYVC